MKQLLFLLLLLSSPLLAGAQGASQALLFSGQEDGTRVEIAHSPNFWPNGLLTVEAWINPNAYPDWLAMIFSKHRTHWTREYDLMLISDGRVRCTLYGADNTPYYLYSNNRVEQNRWTHLAFTYSKESGQMQLYVNGVPEVSRSIGAITMQTTTIKPLIGAYWHESIDGRTRDHFSGFIDEVRIWKTARSQDQIRELMCSKPNLPHTDLIAYYPLDEPSGTTTADATGAQQHGTLIKNPGRQLSAAPLGDASVWAYDNSQYALELESPGGTHGARLSHASGAIKGAHLYRVDQAPNTDNGLQGVLEPAYYGVFQTNIQSRYTLEVSTPSCSQCLSVFSRNDNTGTSWQRLEGEQEACALRLSPESRLADGYRGEYIVSHTAEARPEFSLGEDRILCPGQQLVLAPDAEGNYRWQDGTTAPAYTISAPGTYWLSVQNACGSYTDTLRVTSAPPELNLTMEENYFLCKGEQMLLNARTEGATYYQWQDGGQEPEYVVTTPGLYTVRLGNACTEISRTISVHAREEALTVPNVITPNGDQENEYFDIGPNSLDYSLSIYNRWGKLVYSSPAYENKWNGGELKTGTYYYAIRNACSSTTYRGWLTIMR